MLWATSSVILICSIYLFLIKPGKRRTESVFFAKQKYAHRGLHDNKNGVPENSLLSFRRAMEKGYGVELDVQLTADNIPVVFHDGDLKRMCGDERKVRELTYNELKGFRLLGTDERIPLFTDALDLLGQTPIVCEIKTYPNNSLEVCSVVADILKGYDCRLCIESFNPLAIKYFKKNTPEIIRGQLSMDFAKSKSGVNRFTGFMLKNLLFNFCAKPDFIAFRHTDYKCFSFSLCRKLFKPFCFAWTVTSPAEEERTSQNFDTVIFENYLS
jgi:glycerophosphoryl diester phosphodiesterase